MGPRDLQLRVPDAGNTQAKGEKQCCTGKPDDSE